MGEGIRIGGGGKKEGLNVWEKGNHVDSVAVKASWNFITSDYHKMLLTVDGVNIEDFPLSLLYGKNIVFLSTNGTYYRLKDETYISHYNNDGRTLTYPYTYDPTTGILTMNGTTFNYYGKAQSYNVTIPEEWELLSFVVNNNSNAYPNGAVHTDGYYYKLLGQVTSANVMSLSDNAVATVQQDYRDTIETEVSNANS